MTAQERKDFRRVQKSRNIWKKRAVKRGEDRRRIRQRYQEVDRSRTGLRIPRQSGSGALLVMRCDVAIRVYIDRENGFCLITQLHGGYRILFLLIT
jgi:hypothetical protein